MHRTIEDAVRRIASLFGSLRSTAAATSRQRDPRVVVLATATFAVVAGVAVGLVARWPLAGVVLAFVLAATLAAVCAASGTPGVRGGTLRALSAPFRRRAGGRTTDESASRPESDADADDASAEELLWEAGLLADDAGGGDSSDPLSAAGRTQSTDDALPRIARDFESAWRRRIVEMDGREGDAAALASLLHVPEEDVELEWEPAESALVASVRGERAGNWPSRAAFVADVTAVAEFRSAFPKWWSLSPPMRTRVLAALRLCLDWCPACDGSLSIDRRPARPGDGGERRVSSADRNASRSGDAAERRSTDYRTASDDFAELRSAGGRASPDDADGRRPPGRRDSLGDVDETRRVSSADRNALPSGDATVLASTCRACGADVFAAEIDDGRIDPRAEPADADIGL